MSLQKFKPWRSEPYRRYVASQECFACGIHGYSQCAHSNQSRHGKSFGMKASDEFTFPLCSTRPGHMGHHTEHDLLMDMSHAERVELENRYIERMQSRAREAGWVLPFHKVTA